MKQNLVILCYDYNLSKLISKSLSEYFLMRVLDETELFDFDYSPRSIEDLISMFGLDFVMEKFCKIAGSHCDYENIIFISHLKIMNNCAKKFDKFKENSLIILIESDFQDLENIDNPIFILNENEFNQVQDNLQNSLADICIENVDLSFDELNKTIIEEIKNYYRIEI